MKNKIFTIFLSMTLFFSAATPIWADEAENPPSQEVETTPTQTAPATEALPTVEAASAILIDAATGEILFEKNSQEKQYPASITKLMTVLLALEKGDLTDTVTFSHDAVFGIEFGSSHIALQEGEEITLEQALYAIMIRSANEACLGVAEYISGSKEEFAKLMTQRAKELGCKNTNFLNPNGLHDVNHYTTAYDMSLIAKELLKFGDTFKTIMATTYYELLPTNKQTETRYLHGQHQMIKPPSIYAYDGCEGGKTGFTNEAQNTLVTYAKRENTELIAVVLKCSGAGHYVDTRALFDYGFANYETASLFSKEKVSKEVEVIEEVGGFKKNISLGKIKAVPAENISITLKKGESKPSVTAKTNLKETYTAPVQKGDKLGSLTLSYNGKSQTIDLVADSTLKGSTPQQQQEVKKDLWQQRLVMIGILVLALLLVFVIVLFFLRKREQKRRKRRLQRRRQLEAQRNERRAQTPPQPKMQPPSPEKKEPVHQKDFPRRRR